jgi:GNAT superfamily N-acetyltransferase
MTLARLANDSDLPAILDIAARLVAEHIEWDPVRFDTERAPLPAYDTWIRELLTDTRRNSVIVAEADGRIVGYLIAELADEVTHELATAAVWIHDIYVLDDARGHGSAAAMMNLVIDRHAATHSIRLITAAVNENARRFFTKFGFRISAVEMTLPHDRRP